MTNNILPQETDESEEFVTINFETNGVVWDSLDLPKSEYDFLVKDAEKHQVTLEEHFKNIIDWYLKLLEEKNSHPTE